MPDPIQVKGQGLRRIDLKGKGLLGAVLHAQFTPHTKRRIVAALSVYPAHGLEVADRDAASA